jgi:hypothetical protein
MKRTRTFWNMLMAKVWRTEVLVGGEHQQGRGKLYHYQLHIIRLMLKFLEGTELCDYII